jgi:aminoglycoside 3-N-acetyltransferase
MRRNSSRRSRIHGLFRRLLPAEVINRLRRLRNTLRISRDELFAVDKSAFRQTLEDLGIRPGDIVYVRSSYDDMRSIRATPIELITILCEAVGRSGTIVMPTYPMTGRAQQYLDQHPLFDWRRTPSRSGMLTEIFRRLPDTERSINPTHPLAARGALAEWLTEGHERSETPFDGHSPFQKLFERNALVLSIGDFDHLTLRHFADHLTQDKIPYPIYSERPTKVRVIGKDGKESFMLTKAHNPALDCNTEAALARMIRDGVLRTTRVGRVPLSIVRLQPYIEAYRRYYAEGLVQHSLISGATARANG